MPETIQPEGLRLLSKSVSGSVATMVLQAGEKEALAAVNQMNPILAEAVGLTLEEVFIYEMEAVGYDYTKILF